MKKKNLLQNLLRVFGLVVRRSPHRRNPLLINSLVDFNFRPPLMLVFPGEEFGKGRHSLSQFSTW